MHHRVVVLRHEFEKAEDVGEGGEVLGGLGERFLGGGIVFARVRCDGLRAVVFFGRFRGLRGFRRLRGLRRFRRGCIRAGGLSTVVLRIVASAVQGADGLLGGALGTPRLVERALQGAEATGGLHRIGALALFGVVVFGFGGGGQIDLGGRRHVVGGIQIAHQYVREAIFLAGFGIAIENVADGARKVRRGGEHVAYAFFDALGNGDFAFPREQFHGAHFAHIHAHGVRGAAGFGLDGGQGRGRFLGGQLVRGIVAGVQYFVGIRRRFGGFVDRDPHVVNHGDDVFDLIWIADVRWQVVVDLGVGQVALFLALGNELLESRLLLCGFRGHITSALYSVRREPVRRRTAHHSMNIGAPFGCANRRG